MTVWPQSLANMHVMAWLQLAALLAMLALLVVANALPLPALPYGREDDAYLAHLYGDRTSSPPGSPSSSWTSPMLRQLASLSRGIGLANGIPVVPCSPTMQGPFAELPFQCVPPLQTAEPTKGSNTTSVVGFAAPVQVLFPFDVSSTHRKFEARASVLEVSEVGMLQAPVLEVVELMPQEVIVTRSSLGSLSLHYVPEAYKTSEVHEVYSAPPSQRYLLALAPRSAYRLYLPASFSLPFNRSSVESPLIPLAVNQPFNRSSVESHVIPVRPAANRSPVGRSGTSDGPEEKGSLSSYASGVLNAASGTVHKVTGGLWGGSGLGLSRSASGPLGNYAGALSVGSGVHG